MLIGGEWRQAASSEEIEVVNPATEEVVGAVPSGAQADVELAVATAKRAFPEWAATDTEKRAHILADAAALIEERAKELAAVLTSEQGKPIAEARGEVTHLAHGVRYYAEAATKVRGAYQELPVGVRPRLRAGDPPADRRLRRDHPLQLPAHAAGDEGRAGAGERQHRRRQAGGDDAAGDARGRAHLRRGGRARRRAQRRHRPRRRRSATRSSAIPTCAGSRSPARPRSAATWSRSRARR